MELAAPCGGAAGGSVATPSWLRPPEVEYASDGRQHFSVSTVPGHIQQRPTAELFGGAPYSVGDGFRVHSPRQEGPQPRFRLALGLLPISALCHSVLQVLGTPNLPARPSASVTPSTS